MAAGHLDEALAAHGHATRLVPDTRFYQIIMELARRDVAARRAPRLRGVGMPPDPTLWDDPPDVAWARNVGHTACRRASSRPGTPHPATGQAFRPPKFWLATTPAIA